MPDPATTDDSTIDPKNIAKQLGLTLPPDYSGNVIDLAKRTEQLSKERASKIDPLVKQQAEAAERQPEESERAWRNIEPFKPTPPPDQRQYQENPLTKFFSLGSIVGILASAATHQPWTTSFTAAAAAIDARNRGDAEAYDNAFKAWKDNTQNLFERHQAQTEDWKTLQEKFKDDAIGRDAAIRAYQAKYGDEIDATYRAAGMYGQADDIMQKRNDAILAMQKDYPTIVQQGAVTGAVLKLRAAQKLPDTDPTKQKQIESALKDIQELQTGIPAGKRSVGTGAMTGNQKLQLEDRVDSLGNSLDVIGSENKADSALGILNKYVGAAGLAGRVTRLNERVGNIFGGNETDRVQFMRYIEQLRLTGSRLLLDAHGRPLSSEASRINEIIGGLSAGDTTANTIRSLKEVQSLYTKMREQDKAKLSGSWKPESTNESAPQPEQKEQPWLDAPVVGGEE